MNTRKGNKVYPLTAAQKLHYYCMKYCPKKQVLNIGSSLTIQVELDWELLRKSIKEAISRCESMRVRFAHDEEGNAWQYVVKEDDTEIEYFDFSTWRAEAVKKRLDEWTEVPLASDDAPLYRIVMIKMPDGYDGIYMVVNHLIMDAQSMIMFLRDVISEDSCFADGFPV